MKVHKYRVTCYESLLDFTHGMGRLQTRFYVPGKGIFGCREETGIDFVNQSKDAMAEGEEILFKKDEIKEKRTDAEDYVIRGSVPEYLKEVDLPDVIVEEIFETGRQLDQARSKLIELGENLQARLGQ